MIDTLTVAGSALAAIVALIAWRLVFLEARRARRARARARRRGGYLL